MAETLLAAAVNNRQKPTDLPILETTTASSDMLNMQMLTGWMDR